ncbi:uncharacterized protein PAN0_114d6756 [Moesziomyces antarcticus]|uniref:Uncharacterized protein n=2 Tax=Pseudozyma antarctica TaxID=84753 RepID=A0A5C3FYT3_PSEA2|nr:uncharacterized protein PAN0_114d6756 [Moesziomyces antarcticus]GAK68496.1 conserved hypothetical protein [Moesziomyces antarcticus]SPO49303.1 uncharacterized protein PSANT_06994 [Moesziomyces antarcticus]SPO49311.1 uncharacterized protein PSANT_07003 [Moesziomyces antarcticus]SPO49392.1 uncharacterized protein PSANT_07085 [Moesziomyces antarcticus]
MSSSSAGAQQESHQRVGYDTSTRKWTGQGLAIVSDRSGQVLLSVPIEFLSKGMVNSFAYVLQSIHMAFDVRAGRICSEAGDECSPLDAVTPGRFIYWNAETVFCRPRIGPRFKFMSRPPHAGDDLASTMSNSKRSSANQSKFRFTVVARDYFCLISDVEYPSCTAAHILPVSRPEFGVLLRDDIHHAFDRGHIALYPLSQRDFHGKVIRPEIRFRGPPDDYPDTQMLLFHYQQCVIKCFRGWSAF